jgi:hypothetical protein
MAACAIIGDLVAIVIRNVPDEVLAAIDRRAHRLGLSRSAYLRRLLERERLVARGPTTVDDLGSAAKLAMDLDDVDVISDAWS